MFYAVWVMFWGVVVWGVRGVSWMFHLVCGIRKIGGGEEKSDHKNHFRKALPLIEFLVNRGAFEWLGENNQL